MANGDPLIIAGREFRSRLIMGSGKFPDPETMGRAYEAGGTDMVTVALRRLNLDNPDEKTLLDFIDWKRYAILPNTAGARTAEEAVHTARLARAMGLSDWIKVEVIPDARYLLPDPVGTLEACKVLVKEGFIVMPYINDDPVLARQLEDVGCATVMPLASPIGSGQGMVNFSQIRIIIEQANVPVVVDAGLGVPSDAAMAMEMGADACLINSAIALAGDPVGMARAMALGIEAGRLAYRSGRMAPKAYAAASSPLEGIVGR